MRTIHALSITPGLALALALTACGSPDNEPAGTTGDAAEVEGLETGGGDAGDDAGDTALSDAAGEAAAPGKEADDQASANPVSASARITPTAAPAQVAAAGPPRAFTTCGVCHSVEAGVNMVGPSLAGVVGRRSGSVSGANYSPGMRQASVTWTEANLERYLADPAAVVPGGSMPNPRLNPEQRRAVIDYLKTL